MIARPKQFYMLALFMFMLAISFPLQVILLYGHHWSETSAIFSKITWLNWFVIACFVVSGYFSIQASRYLLVMVPVTVILVAVNNYVVGKFAGDFSMLQTTLATMATGVLFTPLLLPSSKAVIKDPKRRWWRRSQRYNKRVSATINPFVGDMIHTHTYDVSQSGAFVCIADEDEKNLPKVGDKIRLSLNISSMKKIRCEAVVVRITEPIGHYPRGLGIRFIDIEKLHQKSFQNFIRSPNSRH